MRVSPDPQPEKQHRKTGIVCTIGPATNTLEMITRLRKAGMNIARLNMSHGSHAEHERVVNLIRESESLDGMAASGGRPCAIALDTKGPEIRTSKVIKTGDCLVVTEGEEWTVGFGDESNLGFIAVDYKLLGQTVTLNSTVYIDDGNLQLQVIGVVNADTVRCRALNTHNLKPGKAVNLPFAKVKLPSVSEKDVCDLQLAARLGLDMVFASFVRRPQDIECIRGVLRDSPSPDPTVTLPKVIAKIENFEGLENIDAILQVADGVMVARGDLGVELAPEKVFVAQKMIIAKACMAGKPVICATQMLESMCANPRPTRAEATDVANAVLDGADCVMLSAETASGRYPDLAVSLMGAICKEAERVISYSSLYEDLRLVSREQELTDTIACSAVGACLHGNVAALLVLTTSGHSARLVAKYRPPVPIIVVTRLAQTARSLHLHRGCYPFIYPDYCQSPNEACPETWQRDVDKRFYWAMERAIEQGLVQRGDRVVCIQGSKGGVGYTNTMRILNIP